MLGNRRAHAPGMDLIATFGLRPVSQREVLLLHAKLPVRLLLKKFAAVDARREGLNGNL